MTTQPADDCPVCAALRKDNEQLKAEVRFLRLHAALAAGLKGETLICSYTGGKLTSYSAPFDVQVGKYKVEVKWSSVTCPIGSYTRWCWDKPLGYHDHGKDYDFLILVGEKNKGLDSLYSICGWTGLYVGFLLPKEAVYDVLTTSKRHGSQILMNCNPYKMKHGRNQKMKKLAGYRLDLDELFTLMKAQGY